MIVNDARVLVAATESKALLSTHRRSSAGAERVVTRRAGAKKEPSGLTTRPVEAIHAKSGQSGLRTFCDWRRYRSAFNEAIGLPAMSEHLPGVTMTVHLAVSLREASGKR